jgi:hypothetical protein
VLRAPAASAAPIVPPSPRKAAVSSAADLSAAADSSGGSSSSAPVAASASRVASDSSMMPTHLRTGLEEVRPRPASLAVLPPSKLYSHPKIAAALSGYAHMHLRAMTRRNTKHSERRHPMFDKSLHYHDELRPWHVGAHHSAYSAGMLPYAWASGAHAGHSQSPGGTQGSAGSRQPVCQAASQRCLLRRRCGGHKKVPSNKRLQKSNKLSFDFNSADWPIAVLY